MAEAVRVLPAPFIEPTQRERFQADARAFGKGEAGGRRDGLGGAGFKPAPTGPQMA